MTLCLNLEKTDLGPEGISSIIRKEGGIKKVEYQELRGRLYGRSFPLTFYNRQRAIALRSNTLIKLGVRLAKDTGALGAFALYDEGRSYAFEVVDELRHVLADTEEALPHDTYEIEEALDPILGYCVKCRSKREIKDASQIVLKNGKPAMRGVCPVCSTAVFKIGFKLLPKIRNSLLLENLQGFLLASGWGTFELRSEIKGKFGSVTILDPPTFERDVGYGNQFLEGIASGLLEAISESKNKMTLLGQKYDSENRTLHLHFAENCPPISMNVTTSSVVEEQQQEQKGHDDAEVEKPKMAKKKDVPPKKKKTVSEEPKSKSKSGGRKKKDKVQEVAQQQHPPHQDEVVIPTPQIEEPVPEEKEAAEEKEEVRSIELQTNETNQVKSDSVAEESQVDGIDDEQQLEVKNIIQSLEEIAAEAHNSGKDNDDEEAAAAASTELEIEQPISIEQQQQQ